jgi:hypothetical protein
MSVNFSTLVRVCRIVSLPVHPVMVECGDLVGEFSSVLAMSAMGVDGDVPGANCEGKASAVALIGASGGVAIDEDSTPMSSRSGGDATVAAAM